MDLRQLRLLRAVVEHGSFTKAAQAEFVSQPAVSHAIGGLERELGTPLLTRLGRRVEPTAAGEAFLSHAYVAMRELDAARNAVVGNMKLHQGHLDLTALRTLAAAPVANLVGAYRNRYPGVTVNLAAPDSPVHLIDQLRRGIAEIAITEAGHFPSGFIVLSFLKEELVVIAPPSSSPLPSPLPVAELATLSLIATPTGTSSRDHLDRALADAGTFALIGVVTTQREAILPLVLDGAGAALVPAAFAEIARKLGAQVVTTSPPLTRELVVAYRDAPLTPAARAFLQIVGDKERERRHQ